MSRTIQEQYKDIEPLARAIMEERSYEFCNDPANADNPEVKAFLFHLEQDSTYHPSVAFDGVIQKFIALESKLSLPHQFTTVNPDGSVYTTGKG